MRFYSIILFFCLLSFSAVNAQMKQDFSAPDYSKIGRDIKNKNLPVYYPKLMSRYVIHDTTLTGNDYQYLYYGYFFQKEYNVFGNMSVFIDSIKAIYNKDKLTKEDKKNVARFTTQMLKTDPFNLNSINRMYGLYRDLGDSVTSNLYLYKLEMIAKTLFASGDGKTDSTGIHVLSVDDEYSIISMLGFEFAGEQHLTQNQCDFLKLKQNEDGIDGMYFDVKQLFLNYHTALPVKSAPSKNKGK